MGGLERFARIFQVGPPSLHEAAGVQAFLVPSIQASLVGCGRAYFGDLFQELRRYKSLKIGEWTI